jgi:muramoyltetrapeptide carboxypeptidase
MIKKIERLRPGDKIGIIAPGAIFNREKFKAGLAFIKEMGLIPVLGPDLFKKDFIFSGTVDQRVKSFMAIAQRRDIKAIWCVRAGYGVYDVAETLAQMKAPAHPKLLLGMSDATALHTLLVQKWKWPVLHSPLVDRIGLEHTPIIEKNCLRNTLLDPDYRFHWTKGLRAMGKLGQAEGELTGGNLALVVSSLKTRWEVQTQKKILFLEEIGERAYRLDRMLFQLRAAGKFDGVKAVILGDFTECKEKDGRDLSKILLKRHFQHSPFPVLTGVPAGHGNLRLTFPLGVKARVQTKGTPRFEILEGFTRGV